jgi:hypothetical protein
MAQDPEFIEGPVQSNRTQGLMKGGQGKTALYAIQLHSGEAWM